MLQHSLVGLAAVAVAAGTAAIYDRAGVHPQCSEGPEEYMRACVLPSDYFAYLMSADPILDNSTGCAALGFTRLPFDDPPFGFQLFWRGGMAGLSSFEKGFRPGHPQLAQFLNASRDKNPACARRPPPVSLADPLLEAARAPAAFPLRSNDNSVVTAYDASGHLPQCSEGPSAYMVNCAYSCDFVAYLLSHQPVQVAGAHCAAMGFQYAGMDNIYTPVKLYWAKNASVSIQTYFGRFFKNHTKAFGYLNATRDATPACKV
mmetsp:Transcript_35012/g.91636  ORF Transcript_35012/g.91636 Transcript_35012/m.91636 type:complete len:260 (+) Transcript_35012:180-959(+)